MTTLRCGRLDRHEPHEWTCPVSSANAAHRHPTYHCGGRVITEAELRAYDEAADAAEDRAERDAQADREFGEWVGRGWSA